MKRLIFILITLFVSNSISAQNLQDLVYSMDYEVFRVGVDFSNDCLIDKHLMNDTLFITLFTQLTTDSLRWSVNLKDDTLLFNILPDNIFNEIIKYDSIQNTTTYSATFKQHIGFEVNYGFIINFKLLAEIKTKNIKLNNQQLKRVTDKVSYKLIDQDTINRIDFLGMRQGLWASFEEDKLAKIDIYYNDRRIKSYNIDQNGNISLNIDEYGNQNLYLKKDGKKITKDLFQNQIIKQLLDKY